MKRLHLVLLPLLLLAFAPAACSLKRGARLAPVPVEAAGALAEARELLRGAPDPGEPDPSRARAAEAAQRAAALAPDWIAPRRVLDDLAREQLLGQEALAERRAALADGASAAELYLAGRLEGRAGVATLERAAELDPTLSWAQHGLAWSRFLAGDARGALRAGLRAVELARGSHELGFFTSSVARYLLELERPEEAIAHLEVALADARLEQPERRELEVWLARAELESEHAIERGFWRAVGLFEGGSLTAEEVDRLGEGVLARLARVGQPDALSVLESALGAAHGSACERLRARVLLEQGAQALAAPLLERAGGGLGTGAFARVRGLARGDAQATLDAWCAALPARLRDEQGLPREPALHDLMLAARAAQDGAGAEAFGEALLRAGWFAEAEAWSLAMVASPAAESDRRERDASAALALHARAAAGQALLSGMRALLDAVDEGHKALLPGRAGVLSPARPVETLEQLLAALQVLFERYHGRPLEQDLRRSPLLVQGGLATVVHPGPVFSALDEEEGRGERGAPVGGLAAELASIGRFGLFGQAPGGGGPDGTVLRRVGTEWRSGTHLGVPFSGLVAWCEGTDVPSRPGRSGAPVSGAALHEGYWVDIEGVRREWEHLRAREREFLEGERPELERALAGRGPRVDPGAGSAECARWMEPLGEGERILLVVLRERAAAGRPAGQRVPFDELLDLTALHEEGHLTDRTRFLPLAKKWPRVLGFALRYGLSPRAVASALEYRAELVALCDAPDPRLALADCLSASDTEGGVLPHGDAFRELVGDLLGLAARDSARYPALDPAHYLLFQLHFLSGEEVRSLALALARQHGMVEE